MSANESEITGQLEDDRVLNECEAPLLTYSFFTDSQSINNTEVLRKSKADLLHDLFDYVGLGMEKQAEEILLAHPEFLLERSKLTDISNTKYTDTTVFEYAVREEVQDSCMAKMMVRCIKKSHRQKELADHLAQQYDQWFGIRFPISVRHLISRLEKLLQNYDRMEPEALQNAWIFEVGVAQRGLKAIIRNLYCHPVLSFIREGRFIEETLPRQLYFYRSKTNEVRIWDRTALDVGEYFAITRWAFDPTDKKPGARAVSGKNLHKVAIRTDLEALRTICIENSNALKALRREIELLRDTHPEEETSIRLCGAGM